MFSKFYKCFFLFGFIILLSCSSQKGYQAATTTQSGVNIADLASRNDAESQYTLGTFYFQGKEVQQDSKRALDWFVKSANQGYANAQYTLGFIYEKGLLVPKDLSEAQGWFWKAAIQGHSEAQYQLGLIYSKSNLPKDLIKSYAWLSLCSERDSRAQDLIEVISKKLDINQVNEAKKMTSDLKYQNLRKNLLKRF